ncbi:MAG: A/G-specific adenine glycosylase [Caulobacteraceae bacterium]
MTAVAQIRKRLLAWYDANARTLPWRARPGEAADPYRVWLSEIMLQQTTVAHAAPYFLAFAARWPTIGALAAASEDEVMAAWAGLGYYARARSLVACARIVAGELGGSFPSDEASLRALPGLGAYTAAAIAAIAFDAPANVLDGNIERVIARLHALETPLPGAKVELRVLAGELAPAARPGDWAQALMDLGAVVCRPASPLCSACPLARFCLARASGAPETYPRRKVRPPRPHRHGVAFLARRGDAVAMIRWPAKGLFGGMLGLPTTDWRSAPWPCEDARAAAPWPASWRRVGAVNHVFTHFSLDLEVWSAQFRAVDPRFQWLPPRAAFAAAPSLFRKALRLAAG